GALRGVPFIGGLLGGAGGAAGGLAGLATQNQILQGALRFDSVAPAQVERLNQLLDPSRRFIGISGDPASTGVPDPVTSHAIYDRGFQAAERIYAAGGAAGFAGDLASAGSPDAIREQLIGAAFGPVAGAPGGDLIGVIAGKVGDYLHSITNEAAFEARRRASDQVYNFGRGGPYDPDYGGPRPFPAITPHRYNFDQGPYGPGPPPVTFINEGNILTQTEFEETVVTTVQKAWGAGRFNTLMGDPASAN
ncbi:MAG: hypothetical protein OXG72_02590, partial [Acidobacteria bacterium]|nr:hypothetical protein [Acidobacteriota bacterium]